ncbi:MAG: hypothetical protein ACLVEJ_11155 [Parabacteroides sp.]
MSRELAYHPAVRAPKSFKGFMEFEVTGFLSDIRARVDDMLAELDAWPVMYERLIEYARNVKDVGRKAAEGSWKLVPTQRIAGRRDVIGRLHLATGPGRFRMGGTGQSLDELL